MLDTRDVRLSTLITAAILALAECCSAQIHPSPEWSLAIAQASAPQARIVVVDIATGHLLASSPMPNVARTLVAPGSTLKPLVLYSLIADHRWDPSRRIACTRKLTVAGRSLNCSHPPSDPMDARQALAWSCNSYFANVTDAIPLGQLRSILAATGLLSQTGLAPSETTASFRDPRTADETRLTLLGVDGVRVTPLELASAYRWLALQMAAHPASPAAQTVQSGLADSASFGIAGAASLGGVPVLGKTGTANLGPGTPSHGWFAGLAPAGNPQAVIVVYLPQGHGANAAQVAADILAHSPLKRSDHER
jgi:cell division protein FtsI/penicillin-binding protein 2